MDYKRAKEIFDELDTLDYSHLSRDDRQLMDELLGDIFLLAVGYAHILAEWALKTDEEKLEEDQWKSLTYNAFIDACNKLCQNMLELDLGVGWRNYLGNDNKEIGDFACYVHLFLGIKEK